MRSFIKEHQIIISIIAFFIFLRAITIVHHTPAYWDASVYVGMGKYLFSGGTIGTWELLRPVALPVILGLFWKLGLAPYAAGTVLSLMVSSALVVFVYVFGEQVRKGAGVVGAVLLISNSQFFTYSAVPVTDITSTFFALLSLFLVYKASTNKQYFIAGLATAVALMFRFPQGLLLVVAGGIVIMNAFQERGKINDRLVRMIERGFMIGGGFAMVVVPFLVVNYYFYGNAFLPFIEGNAVIKQYPSLYQVGTWFYIGELLKQNALLLFALVPIALVWKKHYTSRVVLVVTIALGIVFAYFTYQSHKEVRYMLSFLPYIAILAGVGILYVLEWCRLPLSAFFGLFAIVAFMIYAGSLLHIFSHSVRHDDEMLYKFNTYFVHTAPGTPILSSTPYTFAYTDAFLTRNLYSDWTDASYAYHTYKDKSDYIALDSCNLEIGCADNASCKDQKQSLLHELAHNDTEVLADTTDTQCQLFIYKINH